MTNQRNCLNSQSANERFDDANMCTPPRLPISTDQNKSTCSATNQIEMNDDSPSIQLMQSRRNPDNTRIVHNTVSACCIVFHVLRAPSRVFTCMKTVCGREKQTQLLNVWRKKHSAYNKRRLLWSLLSIFLRFGFYYTCERAKSKDAELRTILNDFV